MLFVYKTFSTLTCIAVALVLLGVAYQGAIATQFHATNTTGSSGAATLATSFAAFLAACFFGLPNARKKLIRATFSLVYRLLFILVSLGAFLIVWAILGPALERSALATDLGLAPEQMRQGFLFLAVAYTMVFLLPGYAYSELRLLRRIERAASRGHDVDEMRRNASLPFGATWLGTAAMSEATFPQKILATFVGLLFIGVAGSAFYGLREAQFLPSSTHSAWVDANGYWLVFGLGVFLLFGTLLTPRTAGKGFLKNPTVQKVVTAGLCIAIAFFALPAARLGVPALHSFFAERANATIVVTLIERGSEIKKRSCNRIAFASWDGERQRICNIPSEVWQDLAPGDRLRLEGYKTKYGFRYENVRRAS